MTAPRVARALRPAALGVAVALLGVVGITSVAGSNTDIWWWPAGAIVGIIGGAAMGTLFSVEAAGESPDEEYDGAATQEPRAPGRRGPGDPT
jgi:hypothetical protein